MAKIIKCPNCGENVEVPANAAGQVVTCVACGTALRLKSRKKGESGGGGDASSGSKGESLSGSMTTIAPGYGHQASSDDPPSLGSECEVCGKSVDPGELIEERGKMVCRSCLKRPKPTGKAPKYDGLIPFAEPDAPVRRGQIFTVNGAFIGGCAALALYAACSVFLFFNPKPVGNATFAARPDEPAPSVVSTWDVENRPRIEKMMAEAAALKADPTKAKEAKAKYDAIVELARGAPSGSREVTALVDQAEQESEALKDAVESPGSTTAPAPSPTDAPPPPTDGTAPKPAPAVVVAPEPEDEAPKPGSILDDPEVTVSNLLEKGMLSLEAALAQQGEAAFPHATEAIKTFSEARGVLNQLKRTALDDPARVLANHGTGVAHMFLRQYPNAMLYLDRLPGPPDRAATLNRVVVLLQMRDDKLEAIRLLLAHLEKDPEATDVYAINLLGTALSRYGDETVQREKELREANLVYRALVKKLTARRPGERRWGVRWLTPREHDEMLRLALKDKNELARLEKILKMARNQIDEFSRNPQRAAQLAQARSDEQRAIKEIADLRATMTVEEWLTPDQMVPVLPDVAAVNSATSRAATNPTAAR